ncbi:restriction endonuclease subunit S [Dolichospermum planctonicum UHCC 0167]|uniref:restriction endonuclease subunit S n=1 Tax=Dolichospermum planctonicum TaxID=136072 RepID=UPI00144325AF|nr:restriction endonuclease subunit S [Dolichospermum planctonicum]MCW9681832.1 restriction endonuclease subunit S [Dolichospermum planctonicum UHCC 0167]
MENKLQLSSLCEAIVDCEHKTAPIQPWGIPSIRTTNIKNGRIDFKNANRVSEEVYKQWTARLEPKPGDLILAREAPVGDVGIIPPNQKACLGQRTVLIRTNKEKLDSRYLLYLLLTPQMRYKMMSKSEGSTVSHLNMSDIRNLEIPKLPPLSEQKAIAHILSSFDDKIELNRQMNETLEAMARAIFKSWFVDFDPVSAKRSGRQPAGMDTATADLFPDEFEESSLGLIPKGWKVTEIGNICQITQGYSFKSKDFSIDGDILVRLGNFTENGTLSFTENNTKFFNQECREKFKLNPGDLVMCLSDVTQKGLILGKTGFIPNDNRQYLLNQRVAKIDAVKTLKFFLHFTFISNSFSLYAINSANATTVLNLSSKSITEYKLVLPHEQVLDVFSKIIDSLYEKKDSNVKESKILYQIRDTLLPKLMSGEIRVKEAEKDLMQKIQTGGTL